MFNNLLDSSSLYNVSKIQKEELRDGRLDRALNYRKLMLPVIEGYLSPQNPSMEALALQKELDEAVPNNLKNTIENLYMAKSLKAKVLANFIDTVFQAPAKYGVDFDSPPSANDRAWVSVLLVYDLLYYGPVTLLILSRILKNYEDLQENPIYNILSEITYGEGITEVRVNDFESIYYDCGNRLLKWDVPFVSNGQLFSIIERMISESNLLNNASITINASSPIADFEHPCGYIRGAAVIPPAAESPFLTLRVHPDEPYTLEELMNLGMLDKEIQDFLIACQKAGTTIAIAGTMGSGKTTILSALSEHWPAKGRKATIEDTPELRPRIGDLIKMRTIEYDRDDVTNIDVTRLTKACKRHSVRYVVLSEARDSSAWEILQLSQAILGCLMTYHYTMRGSRHLVDQALSTLVSLCKQHPLAPDGDDIKHQIASMVQILLLIEQDPIDNIRRVIRVYYINGYDPMNGGHFKYVELFKYQREPDEHGNKGYMRSNICSEFEEYLSSKGVEYKSN